MTNYAEEQELEKEALESMFPDEYHPDGPDKFRLELAPGEDEDFVRAPLIIQYPPNYPDEKPMVSLNADIPTGLPEEKEAALRRLIDETIEANLGMAMIYTLAETVQEYLRKNNFSEVSMHDMMLNRQRGQEGPMEDDDDEDDDEEAVEEDGEWKGLEEKELCAVNERLTPQTFTAWKDNFDEELIADGLITRDLVDRMTGKRIFEAQAARDKDSGKALGDSVVEVDAELFDDADLPDDDDFLDEDEEE
eukprot:GEMP01053320.1.p1 GENE.GEMP01053320.1~~GEMP01053320.1.p1  ORF type:complete len:256 (+),score=86.61 GEMP01053320.1:22-768(+)